MTTSRLNVTTAHAQTGTVTNTSAQAAAEIAANNISCIRFGADGKIDGKKSAIMDTDVYSTVKLASDRTIDWVATLAARLTVAATYN
jgi:hypothetical protein